MRKTLLAGLAGLLAAPVLAQEPNAPAAPSPVSVRVAAGYDSRYMLYGYRLSRHLLRADASAFRPLDEKTSLWGGAWFGYLPDGTYREIDGYAGVDRILGGGISVGVALTVFNYIEAPFTDKDFVYELATHVSYTGKHLGLSLRDHVDTESDGHLVRAICTYTLQVTERIGAKGTAELGYAFGYYIDGNLPNHAIFRLDLPIQLTGAVTFTPHVLRCLALEAIDSFEKDDTIAGFTVSRTL